MSKLHTQLFRAGRLVEERILRTRSRINNMLLCLPLASASDRAVIRANRKWAGAFAGKRAFVLGNGPSIRDLSLENLRGEVTFSVNDFGSHPEATRMMPRFHCLADPVYFHESERYGSVLKRINENMEQSILVLPLMYKSIVEEKRLFPNREMIFLDLCGVVSEFARGDVRCDKTIPGITTVTEMALILALFMGCSPVFLLGVDLSFLASPRKQVHFSKHYERDVPGKESCESWKYSRLIRAVHGMLLGFERIHDVARSRNQVIYVVGEESYLDEFPRISKADLNLQARGD